MDPRKVEEVKIPRFFPFGWWRVGLEEWDWCLEEEF